MQVRDVMLPAIGSIDSHATLRDAIETLKSLDIDPLPVLEDGKVVGLLYEQDVQQRATADGLSAGSEQVRDVMRTEVVCCVDGQSTAQAIEHIESSPQPDSARRLPVVDENGCFVGLVALEDLRRREQARDQEVTAAGAVQSIDQLVTWDDDGVDYMNDSSFPASDPLPPPTSLGQTENKNR